MTDEHLAHVLGADGVTPVRFDIVQHPDGHRTATNAETFNLGIGDVLDVPFAGGAVSLIDTGADVVAIDLYSGPKGDEGHLRLPWSAGSLTLGDPDDD